ncbi:MAG TPA: LLM class flavin-dependent oxidoreductase [Caulobacteraceae bacterium]|jgi:alkanesulfonate monooxygenase SsuD/methylene tetrahydromethanopterin reductase-like flavin-dependent oxidoreductase (luciferase family)|nr:LLM class flavin-dependent oxidoreductase [Caulobacteraceae bacterium]
MTKLGNYIRWQDRRIEIPTERIQLCEAWGYDALFMGEGLGHDAFSILAYCAAITKKVALGTCIAQIPGRLPVTMACSAQTLTHLVGPERNIMLGIGTSAAVVAESFYGTSFDRPIARLRDYVAVIRAAGAGAGVDFEGRTMSVPYRGPDARGAPPFPMAINTRSDIPLYLAAAGPQMIGLAAEIFDGWFPLPSMYSPASMHLYQPLLEAGFARSSRKRTMTDLDIWVQLDVIVNEDLAAAMLEAKKFVVLYWNSMKSQLEFLGYGEQAAAIDRLVKDGRKDDATRLVPDQYVDDGWLLGPISRIRERVHPWLECGLGGLIIRSGSRMPESPEPESIDVYRAIAEEAGRIG